jgi:hypothetical protein
VLGTFTVPGCPAATDGLDGELARLQDRGTGGMAPLATPRETLDLLPCQVAMADKLGQGAGRPRRRNVRSVRSTHVAVRSTCHRQDLRGMLAELRRIAVES